MGVPFEHVVSEAILRRSRDSWLISQMVEIRDRVEGAIIQPLPEVAGEPDIMAPMPALIADAIDHNAMRAGSITPNIWCPSKRPGIQTADDRASTRRKALVSTHTFSNESNLRRRAYRHLYGYGTYSMAVLPDHKAGRARLELRDPLQTYPEHQNPDDMREPLNVITIYGKSREWIRQQWGHVEGVTDRLSRSPAFDELWDVVEWVDENECIIGILGPRIDRQLSHARLVGTTAMELRRYENRSGGLVPAVVPWRVTLGRVAGQVGHLLHISDWVQKLTALEISSLEQGVQPDMVIIGEEGAEPMLVGSDSWRRGTSQQPNFLRNVRAVQLLHQQPTPLTRALIDNLEQTFNESAGVLAQYQGRTTGALRTGRGIQALMDAAADPRLMELQEIYSRGLTHLNSAILETEKGWWPDQRFTVFTGWGRDRGVTEYTPAEDFDTHLNAVSYPFPGLDIAQLGVILPQRVQAGLISRKTAMSIDPFTPGDAEDEFDQIEFEKLRDAVYASVLAQAGNPAAPLQLADLAKIAKKVIAGVEIFDAVLEAQAEAQERQAQLAPPGAPEMQPGLAAPGTGIEGTPAPMPPQPMAPGARMGALTQMLGALRAQPPNQMAGAAPGPPRR